MSCSSALYAANMASQEVAENGIVNFGSVVRKFGKNLYMSGGNPVVRGNGYYDMDVNITFEATEIGPIIFTALKDGTPIPGARASVTAIVGAISHVSIPAIVRDVCCAESVITVRVTGGDATVTNAAIAIEKI